MKTAAAANTRESRHMAVTHYLPQQHAQQVTYRLLSSVVVSTVLYTVRTYLTVMSVCDRVEIWRDVLQSY